MQATGLFEVALKPLDPYNTAPDSKVGRMSLDKTFQGDLAAVSQGEMLTGGAPSDGSAGYVAIERVTGSLNGREGAFTLQHSGTMTPESQELSIHVIPRSGSGDLTGLSGSMEIQVADGEHRYVLSYELPEAS